MSRLKEFLNIDRSIQRKGGASESILVTKGNQVHLFLIYLAGVYMIAFALINYYYDDKVIAAIVNVSSIPFVIIAYYFFKRGWTIASKLLNLSQIIIVIILIFLVTRSQYGPNNGDSILVFFIPVFIGTMIVFQGKEKRFGYVFAVCILILMSFLILSDFHLGSDPAYTQKQIQRELALNLIGAAIATIMEVIFIMMVSNRIDEELIKTNRELDNFVYSVSHDLRSPLLSIKGLLMLIKEGKLDEVKLQQYLGFAEKSVNRLDDTIREILAYSRNSRLGISMEVFDLKIMAEQIFGDLRFMVGDNFSFRVESVGSTEMISDKSRINTILRNIIDNAVKYRRIDIEHPYVLLSLGINENGDATISISDNGEGISKDKLEKVFDMFYRGTSTGQGTGLGLYICREVLNKLNGKIHVQSEMGKGTTINLSLPKIISN